MNVTSPKAQAIAHIRRVASMNAQGIGYRTGYADGWWEVQVAPEGQLCFGGYAQECYPPKTTLEQLGWRELGALLDACARSGFTY